MIASKEGVPFRQMLTSGQFYYGAEIVTSRGLPAAADTPGGLAHFARSLLADPRIGWVSITDNPGGGPMIPPGWLADVVKDNRSNVVVHLTCKDLNRNGLESAAWRYAAEGFDNILALTGDYPTGGYGGRASPVFDLDSLGLITLLRLMNEGLQVPGRSGNVERLAPTNFFIGCAASPFKRHERELLPQYFKLLRKIRAGAEWIAPQLGYDMRKFHELKLFLESRGMSRPILGNVYRLMRGIAKIFHSGKMAGCVVSDELLAQVEKYAAGPDRGKKFFDELAAKQLACFKGLGFTAGYIGGLAKPDGFFQVIELAESYGENDWRDFMREIQFAQPDEFFLFQHDPKTGMADAAHFNPEYLESLRHPPKSKNVTFSYRLSRKVHDWAFTRGKGLYGLMTAIYRRLDRKPDGLTSRLAHWLEHEAKHLGYGCADCGDCSLPDCAYLCPMSSCSKGSRNGPCGGSAHGQCELLDKDCFWARVYERLKYYGQSEQLADAPVVFYNAALKGTSSWANTYLDRDHHAEAKPAATSESKPSESKPAADKPPPSTT